MAKKDAPQIPYETDVFHIFGAKKFDSNAFWGRVNDRMNERGYPGVILISKFDPSDGILAGYEIVSKGISSQGLHLTQMDDYNLHLELPWLASWGDVELAFAIMQTLADKYSKLEIYLNNNTEHPIALVDGNIEAMMTQRAHNMAYLLEYNFSHDEALGVPGCRREYILDSLDPEAGDEEYQKAVGDAFQNFVAIQWLFEDCHTAGHANVTAPDGEEFHMRFITNDDETFVGCCQKLSLSSTDGKVLKLVDIADFCKVMEDSEYFVAVDRMQFVLKKMPAKEWDKLVNSFAGPNYAEK